MGTAGDAAARLIREEGARVLATLIRVTGDIDLALVDAIDGLSAYPWWHATRAELLQRTGDAEAAREAYRRALALPLSRPQAEHLSRRAAELAR